MQSPKAVRPEIAHDYVHVRAQELHITVDELFARAFQEAGGMRADALVPCRNYKSSVVKGAIPEQVKAFCEKPLPGCANPNCPHKSENPVGRFTKTNARGATLYVCSVECMNATPDIPDDLPTEEERSADGMEVIARVRKAVSKSKYVEVDPARVRPFADGQPRTYFDLVAMDGLTESLVEVGQIFPGLIRKVTDPNAEYELLDGERRWRGVTRAGIGLYRAMLVDIDDEAAPFAISVIANFNREGHTVLEEMNAIIKMHEKLKLTHAQIAKVLGKEVPEISRLYGLRRLAPEVLSMLDVSTRKKSELLPKNAAIEISKANVSPAEQMRMAERIIKRELTIAGLKHEISKAGVGGGRGYTRGPEELRSRTAVRIRRIKLQLGDLKMGLQDASTLTALTGMSPEDGRDILDDLGAARVLLAECERIVKERVSEAAVAA